MTINYEAFFSWLVFVLSISVRAGSHKRVAFDNENGNVIITKIQAFQPENETRRERMPNLECALSVDDFLYLRIFKIVHI